MQDRIPDTSQPFSRIYPACSRLVPDHIWQQLAAEAESPDSFAALLRRRAPELQLPLYLGELARLESCIAAIAADDIEVAQFTHELTVNPTLVLFENSWRNLAFLVNGETGGPASEKGAERVIVWRQPASGRIRVKCPDDGDLLVLKMALEEISASEAAKQGGVRGALIESALIRALDDGIVTGPEPGIKRDFDPACYNEVDRSFFTARIFSLQWHITQSCDLHCRHCYDRKQYKSLTPQQETAILDDLAAFCASHHVHGQVTFTGGNPLLHKDFEKLYRQAAERGFTTAVLGNPTTRDQLERLRAIQPPAFYQVSLEGLAEHNDYMRGRGHFKRIMSFLDLLRQQNIFSMVMLTLSRDNMDQVLPLAEILRGRTDLFTFNRLSLVGEGANLATADPGRFPEFLKNYAEAVGTNPCLGIKDNLLNIIYRGQRRPLFGGCTGFGCGAAFNFITVLADGAVHACRKFPSPLGNILKASLSEIYHSAAAERYRQGAAECRECAIRPVCRGCLAVAHSHGRDIFKEKDPYCFIHESVTASCRFYR